MSRLIYADSLFKRVSHEMSSGTMYLPIDFQEMIANEPTVDAEPVRTATLIRETDRERHWHCSMCGKVFGVVGLMHKYCPECGARLMGGGRDAD